MTKSATIQTRFRPHTTILKALAHPTRLFILEELAKGERAVQEITELVGVEMPTISRHLALLKNAGILEAEKRGPRVLYRLRAHCVLKVFECVREIQSVGQPQ